MRKLFLVALIFFTLVPFAVGAPSIRLDNITINPDFDTDALMSLYLIGSGVDDIDSATFTVIDTPGLNWDVTILPPTGWSPVVAPPKFGATDFGWPANPITGEYKFAEILLSWDFADETDFKSSVFSGGHRFGFSKVELANSSATIFESPSIEGGNLAVPIPSSLLLLGCGIFAVAGISRRKK